MGLKSYPLAHFNPQAVELTLGVSEAEVGDGSASFGQLGGDSLAAIQFAREVSELCGVSLPVSFVLDHSQSLRSIVNKACARCTGLLPRPSGARVLIASCRLHMTRTWCHVLDPRQRTHPHPLSSASLCMHLPTRSSSW